MPLGTELSRKGLRQSDPTQKRDSAYNWHLTQCRLRLGSGFRPTWDMLPDKLRAALCGSLATLRPKVTTQDGLNKILTKSSYDG